MKKMKCDVCGKEANNVCSSACGAISFVYCDDCLSKGLEPYSAIVGMDLFYEDISEMAKKSFVDASLEFARKTPEDLNRDVKKLDEEFNKYMKQLWERMEEEDLHDLF